MSGPLGLGADSSALAALLGFILMTLAMRKSQRWSGHHVGQGRDRSFYGYHESRCKKHVKRKVIEAVPSSGSFLLTTCVA